MHVSDVVDRIAELESEAKEHRKRLRELSAELDILKSELSLQEEATTAQRRWQGSRFRISTKPIVKVVVPTASSDQAHATELRQITENLGYWNQYSMLNYSRFKADWSKYLLAEVLRKAASPLITESVELKVTVL